eukprot:scaffold262370_cov33-Tisochrysis_lutea.AAC.1
MSNWRAFDIGLVPSADRGSPSPQYRPNLLSIGRTSSRYRVLPPFLLAVSGGPPTQAHCLVLREEVGREEAGLGAGVPASSLSAASTRAATCLAHGTWRAPPIVCVTWALSLEDEKVHVTTYYSAFDRNLLL